MRSWKLFLRSSTVIPLALMTAPVGAADRTAESTPTLEALPSAQPRPAPVQLAACGPCAPKKSCNPCAAKGANPCNPCAGAATAVSARCVIPRLTAANPCAAKKAGAPCGAAKGCSPCGAKKSGNPCAAKSANPCAVKNPCAAKGCNPCNPCAATEAVDITPAEAKAAYDCLKPEMTAAYAKSGDAVAKGYATWKRYNTVSYVSATHGARYVNNYGDPKAKDYGMFEKVKALPVGARLAKDSFVVQKDGKIAVGPLFIMQKMPKGFKKASGDWRYTMIMPDGTVFGITGAKNSAQMNFCYECHMSAQDKDSLMFMPEEVRARN